MATKVILINPAKNKKSDWQCHKILCIIKTLVSQGWDRFEPEGAVKGNSGAKGNGKEPASVSSSGLRCKRLNSMERGGR